MCSVKWLAVARRTFDAELKRFYAVIRWAPFQVSAYAIRAADYATVFRSRCAFFPSAVLFNTFCGDLVAVRAKIALMTAPLALWTNWDRILTKTVFLIQNPDTTPTIFCATFCPQPKSIGYNLRQKLRPYGAIQICSLLLLLIIITSRCAFVMFIKVLGTYLLTLAQNIFEIITDRLDQRKVRNSDFCSDL